MGHAARQRAALRDERPTSDIRNIGKDFVRPSTKVEVLHEGSGSTPSRVRALELFDRTLVETVKGRSFRGPEEGC
jgi:hypothetical protein